MNRLRRIAFRLILPAFALLGVYVATYVWNSSCGGYWNKPERDGRDRWSFGLSLHTAILWQPRFGYWSPYRSDFLGAFYSPLVRLDRAYVHPTQHVSDPDFFVWAQQSKPTDWHPHFREAVAAALAQEKDRPDAPQ